MQLKTVPAKACQFAADLQVRANSDESKTAPITLVARSGEAVCHWYWGNVVHDLGGMTVAKPRIPLDYCHDDDEVIGYANKFDTSTGELVATGALIPYSPDPDDKATEIIYKAQQGVPYEASIFFDGPLVVEEVSENATTFVNGADVRADHGDSPMDAAGNCGLPLRQRSEHISSDEVFPRRRCAGASHQSGEERDERNR